MPEHSVEKTQVCANSMRSVTAELANNCGRQASYTQQLHSISVNHSLLFWCKVFCDCIIGLCMCLLVWILCLLVCTD